MLEARTITKNGQRQSNIELLRILAMLMIIGHHFVVHGGFDFSVMPFSRNREFLRWMELGSSVGVNIFVLISGYFLITSRSIRLGKVLKLWGQLVFYSVVLYLVACSGGLYSFNITPIYEVFAPVTYTQWWFASTYFVLFLLSPYINKGLNELTQKQYLGLLALLSVLWCLIPTFARQTGQVNELLWFIYLYALAGYFRLYGSNIRVKPGLCLLLGTGMMLLVFCWAVLFDFLGTISPGLERHADRYFGISQLPMLLSSVFLFLGFSRMKMKYYPLINKLASAAFGVYLLHDSFYTRDFLWDRLFHNASYADSPMLIPYSIGVVLLVYLVCTAVDLLRIATVERVYLAGVTRLETRFPIWMQKLNEKLVKVKH